MIGESMAFDDRGRLYILSTETNQNWFSLMRVDINGDPLIQKRGDISIGLNSIDLSVDSYGNVYILGLNTDNNNNVVIKIDPNFNMGWVKEIGLGELVSEADQGTGHGAILVKNNIIYVTGGANGGGTNWMWTAQLQLDGTVDWIQDGYFEADGGPTIGLVGEGITSDNLGNVYVTSTANQEFGGTVVIKYDSDGNWIWGTLFNYYVGGGDVDINWSDDGYLYTSGVVYNNQPEGTRVGESSRLHWAKLDATTGEIIFQRYFAGPLLEDIWYYKGHNLGAVFNDRLSIAGYTYSNPSGGGYNITTSSNFLTLQMPTDGANTGTYAGFDYLPWTEEIVNSLGAGGATTYLLIPPTTSTFLTTGSGLVFVEGLTYVGTVYTSLIDTTFLIDNTYTNYLSTITTFVGFGSEFNTWKFDIYGNITAPGNISPTTNLQYNLGSEIRQWDSIYAGSIYKNNTPISIVEVVGTPTHSTSTGVIGQIAYDATYLYVCVSTSTWRRTILAGDW